MHPRFVLLIIVLSQFLATSLWFAINATLQNNPQTTAHLTSAVQLGFILGTLFFAFFNVSDRFLPQKVFFVCAILGASINLGTYFFSNSVFTVLVTRVLVGLCLAGIYPVGMKIAASWFEKGLGNALGLLVGALVLGSGLPFFLRALGTNLDTKIIIFTVSMASVISAILMLLFVPQGPYLSKKAPFNVTALFEIFREKTFRSSAFGYFGHMWELYTFWAFLPFFISSHTAISPQKLSFLVFTIFISGTLGCVLSGLLSKKWESKKIALFCLTGSGVCCLLSYFFFQLPFYIFYIFLLLWGFLVVGDSAQFSTLNAKRAPPLYVGSALTITNCIGFAITILSIQVTGLLSTYIPVNCLFTPLALGPALGVFSLLPKKSAINHFSPS